MDQDQIEKKFKAKKGRRRHNKKKKQGNDNRDAKIDADRDVFFSIFINSKFKLQNEIDQQQAVLMKNDRCYVRNEVLEYNPINKEKVEIRTEIKEKQKTFDASFSIHNDRLREWNTFAEQLQDEFQNGNEHKGDNDDDKKEENDNHNDEITKLLISYKKCMTLLVKQHSRAEDIGQHAVALSKSKKELTNIVKQYTVNKPKTQKYEQLYAKYTNLKLKREQLQAQVMKFITEINQITEEENKVNEEKCETLDNLNISVVEKEKYDGLLIKCKQLTSKYDKFEKNVDNKTEEIQFYFASKWDNHERLWRKWSVNDIMSWIQYMVHDNKIKLSNDIDLNEIEKEMNVQQITGKLLGEMEKTDLKLFGFTVFNDITQVYKQIRELVSKYPDLDDVDDGDDVEGSVQITQVHVPQEYICPVSGKIMCDPVIYDGITYDRNSLLEHVKQNGTIPGTDEQYDKDEGLFKNRKLKQKIDAFLAVHPQIVNEGL